MKIIDTIKMYYKFYNEMLLEVNMSGGVEGKYRLFNKKEALDFIKGYENEEVFHVWLEVNYLTNGKAGSKMKYPMLTIYYYDPADKEKNNNN